MRARMVCDEALVEIAAKRQDMRLMQTAMRILFASWAVLVSSAAFGADNPFDGTYSGTRVLTKHSDEACPQLEKLEITIRNGEFTFSNSNAQAVLAVIKVSPNGSFDEIHEGGKGSWYISGRITDNQLEAEANTPACFHHWSLKRK